MMDKVEDYSVDVCIDWGTWKWVAAYAMNHHGKRSTPVYALPIAKSSYEVRMMAAWHKGRLVQGLELEDLIEEDSTISDKVIDLFKLALYPSAETSKIRNRVEKVLAGSGKDLDMLVTEHLKAVVKDIKEALSISQETKSFSKAEIKDLLDNRLRIRITVPEMWTPDARRRMQKVAKEAGLNIVVLASEPQCALAFLMDGEAQRNLAECRKLQKGDQILVADLGSGTGDFVLYRLLEKFTSKSRLEPAGLSSGELCGSSRVDILLYEKLYKRMGRDWFLQSARELGLKERDMERRTLVAIEKSKREYRSPRPNVSGSVPGYKGEYARFVLEKEEIYSALDEVISIIKAAIYKLIQARGKPKVIYLTRGFAKSGYLEDCLFKEFDPLGILVLPPSLAKNTECFPVAMGGLYRYDNIEKPSLPLKFGYAILARQLASEEQHPDAYEKKASNADGTRPLKEWVEPSSYDESKHIVENRILNIVQKGEVIKPGKPIDKAYNMEFYVPTDDPHISARFVYMDESFDDDSAAREEPTETEEPGIWEESDYKPGIHHWTDVSLPIKKSDLRTRRFEVITSSNGEKFWKLYARVSLKCRKRQDMEIGFAILEPKTAKKTTKKAVKKTVTKKVTKKVTKTTKKKAKKSSKKRKRNPWDDSGSEPEPEPETEPESEDGEEDNYYGKVAFTIWEKIWESSHSEFIE